MRRSDRGIVLGLYRSAPSRELIECARDLGIVGIDTAYNYQRFGSHRWLAHAAGDLLSDFTISTKVGFFPGDDPAACAVHSLDPHRLYEAVERSVESLDRVPDVVFLHTPEQSLTGCTPGEAAHRLAVACGVLANAVRWGLAGSWGIASWDPRPLVRIVEGLALTATPSVLLLRAGLSVGWPVLAANERLAELVGVPDSGRWGMAPFGGNARGAVWGELDLGDFVPTEPAATTTDIAFRVAYEVSPVQRVAVGTGNKTHLHQLAEALDLPVDGQAVQRYRQLIREHDGHVARPVGFDLRSPTGAARPAKAADRRCSAPRRAAPRREAGSGDPGGQAANCRGPERPRDMDTR